MYHSQQRATFLMLRRGWSRLMNVSNVDVNLYNFSSIIVTSSASNEFSKIDLFHNLHLGVCFDESFTLPM
jgi:hypothetical protein